MKSLTLAILVMASASSPNSGTKNNFNLRRKLPPGGNGNGGEGGSGGGGGNKDSCFGEPSGGVHVCTLEDAHSKCGTKGSQRNDPRYRHVVCCCHSDTCPSACCETDITNACDGKSIDDALDKDGSTIIDSVVYNCMKEKIDNCNKRGTTVSKSIVLFFGKR